MVPFSKRLLSCVAAVATGLGASCAMAQAPLDPFDPAPRTVLVRREASLDPADVAQSFGSPVMAAYSATGTTGTLEIPISSHEQLRSGFLDPVPSTFTAITITIDLITLEAVSTVASGDLASGPISQTFSEGPLDSAATLGFIGPDTAPFTCGSQAEVDTLCLSIPLFCGQTCTLVAGAPFNPFTGTVNLVGASVESGCDGAFCQGPFTLFSANGDMLVTELPETSADSPNALATLITLLSAAAAVALVRKGRVAARRS